MCRHSDDHQVHDQAERRIGGPLFERTSRTVRLTPLGERLRDDLLPAHLQIQQAVDRAVAEARGITGALRVGHTTPWCADLAFRAVEVLRGRDDDCAVRIQEIQFDDPFGPLRRGELDLQLSEFVPFQEGPTLDYSVLWSATGQTPPALAFVDLLVDLADPTTDDG
ncbi:hypothetical protein GCM10009678_18900 [Actinomadura kijaniata]|uniref:DNA-binding transcriptional LysR family regulator n=1 Tax=Actinomadura namibiensis TaxID=182080 RepID=A0A7W3LXP7_ACTNM|nr:LysR family transcriptional regulator [Actinomadura namibiensis]MBA8956137.1 DNA-binding transcriptional LysR family regulator [Actinomadura namibiensis]